MVSHDAVGGQSRALIEESSLAEHTHTTSSSLRGLSHSRSCTVDRYSVTDTMSDTASTFLHRCILPPGCSTRYFFSRALLRIRIITSTPTRLDLQYHILVLV